MKNLSIKMKVLIIALGSLIVLGVVLATISTSYSKNALMKQSFDKLTSTRDIKTNQVESFFQERIGDIKVFSKSENVYHIVNDLMEVYNNLEVKSDENYPVDNQLVKEKKEKHEEFFHSYMKDYGYYDIFVISADYGHVMYTVAKESDYGENLSYGNLKESMLAVVWKKAKNLQRPVFVDMKPYTPSNGAPAMFLGTPVVKNGKTIAVLVFQISDEAINKIMRFREGFGQSEETYLVGSDKLMRSDSYLDPKNHSLKASFSNPQKGKVDTQATKDALNGIVGEKIVIDYNGNPVLSSYGNIKVGDDFKWSIMAEIDEAEVLQTPNKIRNIIIIATLILLVIIGVNILIFVNRMIVNPLKDFQTGLISFFKYLNKESSSANDLVVDREDEIGNMSKIVNENIQKIKEGIELDKELISDASDVLNEVNRGVLTNRVEKTSNNKGLNDLKTLINEMLQKLEDNVQNILHVLDDYSNYNYLKNVDKKDTKGEIAKLTDGINNLGIAISSMLVENKQNGLTLKDSSDMLLDNVKTLSISSNEAAASLEETAAALEEITTTIASNSQNILKMSENANLLTKSVDEGQKMAANTTTSMDEINDQVTAINDAITIIDQIAFQTNILSLNAAVEAATAGEAGKGFAVVAQEVRNLAARSAEAASEIKNIVEQATIKANAGKKVATEMIEGYNSLNSNIQDTIDLIGEVSNASKEQQSGIEQINDAINSLDQQTQKNASIANQTQEIADSTNALADEIVSDANSKEFKGKDSVQGKSVQMNKDYESFKKIQEPMSFKQTTNKNRVKTTSTSVSEKINNNSGDEWESF